MDTSVRDCINRFLAKHTLPPGATLLAAVSGGADSLALLHALADLRAGADFALCAGHVHHGMREDADDDVSRLQETCDGLCVPLHVGRADVPGIADAGKLSLEVAGRQARYGYLYQTAIALGAYGVCTGHTKDDQAETLLLRIIAGTGIEGLGGIAPARLAEPPESPAPVWLWRPILEATRSETAAFCAERGIAAMDDPANADPRYPRNRVRHTLLPMLEREFNPAIRDALFRLADLAREDEAILNGMAEGACAFEETEGGWRINTRDLMALPLSMQRRVARRLLRAAGGTGKALAFDNVERLLWAVSTAQRECHLHGGFALRCKREWATLGSIQNPASSIQDSGPEPNAGC